MIFADLFFTFLKIGAFTFGGGYAMLPLIREEIVAHGWLDLGALVDFIAVSESTPGPFAINIATYVGSETAGPLGAVCATLGVTLPSFVVILIVARFYVRFRESRMVKGVMTGLRPAVTGLIAGAILSLCPAVFFPEGMSMAALLSPAFLCAAAIFGICVLLSFKKCHPIVVILSAAALGVLCGVCFLPA